MTFLFILLVLFGLMGLDWHFNVLPIVSETFSYENYDFFKSWKNAKDGVGGVQVRQSAAFVLKRSPLRALSHSSHLVKALNQQMVPPVSTGDISGLPWPWSAAPQDLCFHAGEPARMLRLLMPCASCRQNFQLRDQKRGKKTIKSVQLFFCQREGVCVGGGCWKCDWSHLFLEVILPKALSCVSFKDWSFLGHR